MTTFNSNLAWRPVQRQITEQNLKKSTESFQLLDINTLCHTCAGTAALWLY